ncbi:MAG: FAD-binding oxidoreductase, partial [Candidatus Rokubacteria bacterium]|nr:FAD-binding oxidoreductase [Candidatus Rokubacteria bacterium]
MADLTAEVVICGAGIAGIAAAYHLAVTRGMTDVVLVERGAPLSLTSDKSTECYRNWWPGPDDAMVGLMNRSIDLLEQIARRTDNLIGMNRRGYLFATADPARVLALHRSSAEAERLGSGPLRVHDGRSGGPLYVPGRADGFEGQPDGADLITDPGLIREYFPYLSPRTVAVLHTRRGGWFSAQQLGMYMLEEARRGGVRLLRGEVTAIDTASGRVRSVTVATDGGARTISTPRFVNAAGPLLKAVGEILGIKLPVVCERHLKLSFNDHLEAVPRGAPLLIWSDDVVLPWSETEREALASADETRWLLGRLPPGVHCRPEGHGDSQALLVLWTYDTEPVEPVFPLP